MGDLPDRGVFDDSLDYSSCKKIIVFKRKPEKRHEYRKLVIMF